MKPNSKVLTLCLALTTAFPALAQDNTAGDGGETSNAPETATPAAQDAPSIGQSYVAEEFKDWQLRCVKTDNERDPCQLYQLLRDAEGNSVAEINFFALPPGGEAVAGAQAMTPLETLLTADLRLKVDDGDGRRYPYSFCTTEGCVSRLGFTQQELDAFKAGAKATITIVPAVAPDARVDLTMSLSGFTAGYTALVEAAGLGGN
jgi:invasion protein IalB